MTVYQWVCVLGIPGMLAGLAGFFTGGMVARKWYDAFGYEVDE